VPKVQRKLLHAVSKEQLDSLLAHCHSDRDKALISFLWYSSVRLSEAAKVRALQLHPVSQIDSTILIFIDE